MNVLSEIRISNLGEIMYRSVIFALSIPAIMAVNLAMAGGQPPPPNHNQWL